jgi:hypothetical protein
MLGLTTDSPQKPFPLPDSPVLTCFVWRPQLFTAPIPPLRGGTSPIHFFPLTILPP